jgi:hypothetical protein
MLISFSSRKHCEPSYPPTPGREESCQSPKSFDFLCPYIQPSDFLFELETSKVSVFLYIVIRYRES